LELTHFTFLDSSSELGSFEPLHLLHGLPSFFLTDLQGVLEFGRIENDLFILERSTKGYKRNVTFTVGSLLCNKSVGDGMCFTSFEHLILHRKQEKGKGMRRYRVAASGLVTPVPHNGSMKLIV